MASGLAVRVDLTSDPAAAASGLDRLWAIAPPSVRSRIEADRGLAQALLCLFAGSEFLTEALLHFPDWVLWLARERERPSRPPEEWASDLAAFTADLAPADRPTALSRFQRREFLRIAARDLQGIAALAETTRELSDLADAVLQQAFVWSWNDLVGQFGIPHADDGMPAGMVVLALGKLGGAELNYCSDIDLMFAYRGEGHTRGTARSLDNSDFFTRLARSLTRCVSDATAERPAYRVDLRLRPGGREGELVPSLAALEQYYRLHAREWELQMLVRARGCAGSRALADQFLSSLAPLVYPSPPDAARLAAGVRASHDAIRADLLQRRARGHKRSELDLKLDPGGIRDLEFLTQYWQRLQGGSHPWVRSPNTLLALQRLHDARRISGRELQTLAGAYTLLRHAEHRLQLRLGQQTHSLPSSPHRLLALARSLTAVDTANRDAAPDLRSSLAARMQAVSELYAHYLEVASVPQASASAPPALAWPADVLLDAHAQRQAQRLARSLATTSGSGSWWHELPVPVRRRVALALTHSDWMADQLIRRPQLAGVLTAAPPPDPTPAPGLGAAMTALRIAQQGAWLRLLAEEWESARDIATTLALQTQVAVSALQAGLALASAHVPSLAILGLGRLGLGDLDLLSDVDVVFVASTEEREPAAVVAAHWIEIMTAYTQAGTLYAVDARLRPGGREGELIQTPASLARYFDREAGLWEAVSYLKARHVAGNPATAQLALAALAAPLRRRFQGCDCAPALRSLRDRIQAEGHPGHWGLKTVPGGYYDIDFVVSLSFLRAAAPLPGPVGLAGWAHAAVSAGLLPAPQGRELAVLTRYLRAADHALRVATGKAGSAVPAAGAALERAWRWLRRIHPASPPATAFPGEPARLAAARSRVRAIYQDLL